MTPPEYPNLDYGVWANLVYVKVLDITGNVSTDKVGRFPVTSRCGSKYIMVMHDSESDSILLEVLQSYAKNELFWATEKLYNQFTDRVL